MVRDVPDTTMLKLLLAVLVTATYSTDVNAYSITLQLPNINETENLAIFEDYDIENRNNTSGADQSTGYYYIDFPKIGYQIFKEKMAQAMDIYESFMNKNPVILKIDKTKFSNNGTINLTISNNNKTNKVSESFSDAQQNPETNIESPFVVNTTDIYGNSVLNISELNNVTQTLTNYDVPELEISTDNKPSDNEGNTTTANEANNTTASVEENGSIIVNEANKTVSFKGNNNASDKTKKPETAPVGFFQKISNFFHSLTSWF